jgi:hypothetical protein
VVEADIADTLTTGIIILTPFILLGINYWNSQQIKKKEMQRKHDEEGNARELKEANERIAVEVKNRAERIAEDLKNSTSNILMTSKTYTENTNKEIIQRIEAIDRKVMEMLNDLRKRADLTNGNVATLRTDIADLQEQMEELFEDRNKSADERKMSEQIREKRKKQRTRRREIDANRIAQSERSLNPSAAGERY